MLSYSVLRLLNLEFLHGLHIQAPAAFGLVSFLLVEGLERARVKRHLLAFSLSAPITALLTFYILVAVHSFSLLLINFLSRSFGFNRGLSHLGKVVVHMVSILFRA